MSDDVAFPQRQLSLLLSQGNLTDAELLYIADAVYLAEDTSSPEAKRAFQRHKNAPKLSGVFYRALKQRNIDPETGTKVVTQTIDLLA